MVLGKRIKAWIINWIITGFGFGFIALLAFFFNFINIRFIIYPLIVLNLFFNSFIISPGYKIMELEFTGYRKKIKVFIINIIYNSLFILIELEKITQKKFQVIGEIILLFLVLNVYFMFITKKQTFFEYLFKVELVSCKE